MSNPGYAYLMTFADPSGRWEKVGVAASTNRVRDHQGWLMVMRTVGEDRYLLRDPLRDVEQLVLAEFPVTGGDKLACDRCGARKPPVGRGGADGLTEVRHVSDKCYSSMRDSFARHMGAAPRLPGGPPVSIGFDPTQLRPNGFILSGGPYRQPPRAKTYLSFPCNVLCVRERRGGEVLDLLDEMWRRGVQDLRQGLNELIGSDLCGLDGLPSPAKGSGATGERADVEGKLSRMARIRGVAVVLLTVRPGGGMLYAYAKKGATRRSTFR